MRIDLHAQLVGHFLRHRTVRIELVAEHVRRVHNPILEQFTVLGVERRSGATADSIADDSDADSDTTFASVRVGRQLSVTLVASAASPRCNSSRVRSGRAGRRLFDHHRLWGGDDRRGRPHLGRICRCGEDGGGRGLGFVRELEAAATAKRRIGTETIVRRSGSRWRGYFNRRLRGSKLLAAGVRDHDSVITVVTVTTVTGVIMVIATGVGADAAVTVVRGCAAALEEFGGHQRRRCRNDRANALDDRRSDRRDDSVRRADQRVGGRDRHGGRRRSGGRKVGKLVGVVGRVAFRELWSGSGVTVTTVTIGRVSVTRRRATTGGGCGGGGGLVRRIDCVVGRGRRGGRRGRRAGADERGRTVLVLLLQLLLLLLLLQRPFFGDSCFTSTAAAATRVVSTSGTTTTFS